MRENFSKEKTDRERAWPGPWRLPREELRNMWEGGMAMPCHSSCGSPRLSLKVPTRLYLPRSPDFTGPEARVEVLTLRHPGVLKLLITDKLSKIAFSVCVFTLK